FGKIAVTKAHIERVVEQELESHYFKSARVFEFFCELTKFAMSNLKTDPQKELKEESILSLEIINSLFDAQTVAMDIDADLIQISHMATMKIYDALQPDTASTTDRRALALSLEFGKFSRSENNSYFDRILVITEVITRKENVCCLPKDVNAIPDQLEETIRTLSQLQLPDEDLEIVRLEAKLRKLANAYPQDTIEQLKMLDRFAMERFVALKKANTNVELLATTYAVIPCDAYVLQNLYSAIVAHSSPQESAEILLQLLAATKRSHLRIVLTELSSRQEKGYLSQVLSYLRFFHKLEAVLIVAIEDTSTEVADSLFDPLQSILDVEKLIHLSEGGLTSLSVETNKLANFLLRKRWYICEVVEYAYRHNSLDASTLLSRAQKILSNDDFIEVLQRMTIDCKYEIMALFFEHLEIEADSSGKPASVESKAGEIVLSLRRKMLTTHASFENHFRELARAARKHGLYRAAELFDMTIAACDEGDGYERLKTKHEFGNAYDFRHLVKQITTAHGVLYMKRLMNKIEQKGDACLSARIGFELVRSNTITLAELVHTLLAANNLMTLTWLYFHHLDDNRDFSSLNSLIQASAMTEMESPIRSVDTINYFSVVSTASIGLIRDRNIKKRDWVDTINISMHAQFGQKWTGLII
ncbi:MAG: hypothetical protein K2Z81_23540, partial [Cyanobacteria bacterium]|nr:hypothetical protein [Cyanobacteriota bacterium]